MKAYLEIVNRVIDEGVYKGNRTGIGTYAIPNVIFSHNMSDGFPLLTTREMPVKSMCVELEGFIKGITDKKWYQDRNCHFWDYWANPYAVKLGKRRNKYRNPDNAHIEERDLGPIYGFQWSHFGEAVDEDDSGLVEGYNQLRYIVDTLKTNPNDRRMVCSAWSPNQLSRMALPPCHLLWGVVHIDGVLSLWWTQRSCDLMLGVPNNIASYALLLELLCKESGMRTGNLTGLLADCHIYENHMVGAMAQINRIPDKLPTITFPRYTNIYEWQYNDIELLNYNPQDKISFGAIAV